MTERISTAPIQSDNIKLGNFSYNAVYGISKRGAYKEE
jgi:hypothetical protein